jgi:hypothetical protein
LVRYSTVASRSRLLTSSRLKQAPFLLLGEKTLLLIVHDTSGTLILTEEAHIFYMSNMTGLKGAMNQSEDFKQRQPCRQLREDKVAPKRKTAFSNAGKGREV